MFARLPRGEAGGVGVLLGGECGARSVLLVLLHDFPEFLSDYHVAFCDVIPHTCIQLRNLVLSAFPRNMRLPDPFTPNLKVDLLPEIGQSPRILNTYSKALVTGNFLYVWVQPRGRARSRTRGVALTVRWLLCVCARARAITPCHATRSSLDGYLKTRSPPTFLADLRQQLLLSQREYSPWGTSATLSRIVREGWLTRPCGPGRDAPCWRSLALQLQGPVTTCRWSTRWCCTWACTRSRKRSPSWRTPAWRSRRRWIS